ncbi:MAG: glutamate formimidoyltransferase [Bacteroidota bacterium]
MIADRLLECVPNFSEGKSLETLSSIAEAIRFVPEVTLLHQDRGESANRTVFTFAGKPEAVVEAAFRAMEVAANSIDMRLHHGVHPRMGAIDVCPLVPIEGITKEEVILLAHKLAKRVGEALQIPVYLYEQAATASHRKNLARIRKGEYEGFQEKIKHPKWIPDYGPRSFQPRVGQTVIGARNFLIAYNINLSTQEVNIAQAIAEEIRESGKVVETDGRKERIPGKLKCVKAIGWRIPEFGFTQVSTNLVDMYTTPPHVVFETVKDLAQRYGTSVTGSELVGLIPRYAMIEAGKFYSDALGNGQLLEKAYVDLSVEKLGLNHLYAFDPKERVLEYAM